MKLSKTIIQLIRIIYTVSAISQVHISLTNNHDEMAVTWSTYHQIPSSITPFVKYGIDRNHLDHTAKAQVTKWTYAIDRYTYRSVMRGLKPGQRYYYQVGSNEQWSQEYEFRQPDPNQNNLRVAIFGDFSVVQGKATLNHLIRSSKNHSIDLIIHIGDIAYDLDGDGGRDGDAYLREIEGFAAYIPYMVFPGNHESWDKYVNYNNRFSMPDNGVIADRHFWSLNFKNIHFTALNSEYYASKQSKLTKTQFAWFQQDLQKNRRPWNIVMFHRPLYCSTQYSSGCNDPHDTIMRKGNQDYPGLEKTIRDNKIDVVFYGHKHTYERTWPMYDGKPNVGNNPNVISKAQNPMYILSGAAGCHTHETPAGKYVQPYSAVRRGEYGYSLVTVVDNKNMKISFIDATNDRIVDNVYISK